MKDSSSANGFGTFSGVFVPNILTILGVIMFMRMGWVVGQAGLYQAWGILIIANLITFLSALSMSSIATNTRVEGGGAYFLISRSLGIEIGSSIGVPFFLAQTVSVAFYIVGFTESLTPFIGDADPRLISMSVLAVIFIISWVSSDLAIKAQNLILLVLTTALVSFFAGWNPGGHLEANLKPAYTEGFHFWAVFAIFFPAVTGIMAGASMSGDLKDPSRSIPRGTLWAVAVTFAIYAAQIFWFSHNTERSALVSNAMIMRDTSTVPALIYAGLWAATLSSAIASLLGAPRTLQALAKDGVGPRLFSRLSGKRREPRIALVVSMLMAGGCLIVGDLNLIAPVISMFFLATYAMINLVAGIEAWSGNPSYRPKFKVHWSFSFVGAIGCIVVMFLLNALATLVAAALMILLYLFLLTRRYETAWGDTWSGFWFNLTRTALIKFGNTRKHIRNWRPVILVLSGNPNTRSGLVSFANLFESKKGFIFLAQILVGNSWPALLERRDRETESMDRFINDARLTGESRVIVTRDFESGVCSLIQSSGVGPLVPNTVMLGWSGDMLNHMVYLNTLKRVLELHMNLLIHAGIKDSETELESQIDVWWGAEVNGSLMLIFAHLLGANREWKNHRRRVLMIAPDYVEVETREKQMNQKLEAARIEAEVVSVVANDSTPMEIIQEHSKLSEVCFIGFNLDGLVSSEEVFQQEREFLNGMMGNVFLTKNWQELTL